LQTCTTGEYGTAVVVGRFAVFAHNNVSKVEC
jgi:hypothetical protein